MGQDRINPRAQVGAGVQMAPKHADEMRVHGRYSVVCYGKDGREKWREEYDNLVTTLGANKMLDTTLGNAAGGAIIMGLKGSGSAAAGDTQASHAGWVEVGGANAPAYTGTRKSPAFNAASARSKSSVAQAFAITSAGTVAGTFINIGGSTTKDDTTGTLFSAGDFTTARTVDNGDTINATYTLSV